MNNSYIRTLIVTLLIIGLQVWVLSPINLFRVATPLIYPVLLFLMPMSRSQIPLLLFGFVVGSLLDYFGFTPGLHASAMTVTAFARYYFVQLTTDAQDNLDHLPLPSVLGTRSFVLLAELLLTQHIVIYLLSSGLHGDLLYSLLRFGAGYIFSYILSVMALLSIGLRL